MSFSIVDHNERFELESGKDLAGLRIAYHTYGTLNSDKSNVVWVCHALTANSDVFDWWKGLFGEQDIFNPKDYFIICPNTLGSPYGTTSPVSADPETGKPYLLGFPQYTVRDMAKVHILLADHLKIEKIHMLVGGSLGGQQALEWSILQPRRIQKLVLLATNAVHSPWGIAFNESQRLALLADPSFRQQEPGGGTSGLQAARSIALLSYRGYHTYHTSQQEDTRDKTDGFKASSYQRYQGQKLVNRFDAYSYWYLTKATDSHNVGRNRKSITKALSTIKAKTLVIGISSDLLFPPSEQEFIAGNIPEASYRCIDSLYGHDGFLIETVQISKLINQFITVNNK